MTKEKRDEIRMLGHENDPPKRHFNVSPGRQGNWGPPWPPIETIDDEPAIRLMVAVVKQAADDYRNHRNEVRAYKKIWQARPGVNSRPNTRGKGAVERWFESKDFDFWSQGTGLKGAEAFQRLQRDEDEKDEELKEIWKKLEKGERLGPFSSPPWWLDVFARYRRREGKTLIDRYGGADRIYVVKRRKNDKILR